MTVWDPNAILHNRDDIVNIHLGMLDILYHFLLLLLRLKMNLWLLSNIKKSIEYNYFKDFFEALARRGKCSAVQCSAVQCSAV